MTLSAKLFLLQFEITGGYTYVLQWHYFKWDFRFSPLRIWRWPYSGLLNRLVWYKFTDVSEVLVFVHRHLLFAQNTKAAGISETSVNFYQTRQGNNLEDGHLQDACCFWVSFQAGSLSTADFLEQYWCLLVNIQWIWTVHALLGKSKFRSWSCVGHDSKWHAHARTHTHLQFPGLLYPVSVKFFKKWAGKCQQSLLIVQSRLTAVFICLHRERFGGMLELLNIQRASGGVARSVSNWQRAGPMGLDFWREQISSLRLRVHQALGFLTLSSSVGTEAFFSEDKRPGREANGLYPHTVEVKKERRCTSSKARVTSVRWLGNTPY
jgi:hypothetical protein